MNTWVALLWSVGADLPWTEWRTATKQIALKNNYGLDLPSTVRLCAPEWVIEHNKLNTCSPTERTAILRGVYKESLKSRVNDCDIGIWKNETFWLWQPLSQRSRHQSERKFNRIVKGAWSRHVMIFSRVFTITRSGKCKALRRQSSVHIHRTH